MLPFIGKRSFEREPSSPSHVAESCRADGPLPGVGLRRHQPLEVVPVPRGRGRWTRSADTWAGEAALVFSARCIWTWRQGKRCRMCRPRESACCALPPRRGSGSGERGVQLGSVGNAAAMRAKSDNGDSIGTGACLNACALVQRFAGSLCVLVHAGSFSGARQVGFWKVAFCRSFRFAAHALRHSAPRAQRCSLARRVNTSRAAARAAASRAASMTGAASRAPPPHAPHRLAGDHPNEPHCAGCCAGCCAVLCTVVLCCALRYCCAVLCCTVRCCAALCAAVLCAAVLCAALCAVRCALCCGAAGCCALCRERLSHLLCAISSICGV